MNGFISGHCLALKNAATSWLSDTNISSFPRSAKWKMSMLFPANGLSVPAGHTRTRVRPAASVSSNQSSFNADNAEIMAVSSTNSLRLPSPIVRPFSMRTWDSNPSRIYFINDFCRRFTVLFGVPLQALHGFFVIPEFFVRLTLIFPVPLQREHFSLTSMTFRACPTRECLTPSS